MLSAAIFSAWPIVSDPIAIRAIVIGERALSITATIWMLWALLAPIRATLDFLETYNRSGQIEELPTEFPDEAGRLMSLTRKVVTDLDATVGELAKVSTTDSLTNVRNRRFATERLGIDITGARDADAPLTLALIDLDNLKETNTREGHRGGDESLKKLAMTIQAELGPQDWIARWGGDEFLVLFWGACPSQVSRRLRDTQVKATDTRIEFSAGVALVQEGMTAEEALAHVDALLYEAKLAGKGRVVTG